MTLQDFKKDHLNIIKELARKKTFIAQPSADGEPQKVPQPLPQP